MREDRPNPLRALPPVDEVLRRAAPDLAACPRVLAREAARRAVEEMRGRLAAGRETGDREDLAGRAVRLTLEYAAGLSRPHLRRVINATGVVLHTNLGRSPLAEEALAAVTRVAGGYANLELDLGTGRRGSRYQAVEGILTRLTGAQSALVVNNNAAAVLLALGTLAAGREVVVSRGQLVEIGGSFRIPDVMAASGAVLVEAGTTNKTYRADYERACGERTALLLQVHTSNYRVVGFVHETTTLELVELGRERGLPVMCDLGSGCLADLAAYQLPGEPTVSEVVAAGADVVTFSGDKLLGGPQAGIIVGRRDLLERMKKNPLTRALRIDKMTAAALEATLRVYLDPERALAAIPVLRMLTMDRETLRGLAGGLAAAISRRTGPGRVALVEGISRVGGGALPLAELPAVLVELTPPGVGAAEMQRRLREGPVPVMVRVQEDRVLFDPRTLLPGDGELLAEQVAQAIGGDGICVP
ncbi:MAG: L-seryl-tRNA(Sec) selenium transferase [Peptococcaceae bacterium]|nr:L-seryl-tRNA(Sec) selenium transferase [Peptococcaceae bacterium]